MATTHGGGFGLSRIGQISARARDLDQAVAFYRDALGMRLLFQAPPGLAFFQCGDTTLMLSAPESPEFDHRPRSSTSRSTTSSSRSRR